MCSHFEADVLAIHTPEMGKKGKMTYKMQLNCQKFTFSPGHLSAPIKLSKITLHKMIEFKQNFETYFSNPSTPSFNPELLCQKFRSLELFWLLTIKNFTDPEILVLAEKMAEFVG